MSAEQLITEHLDIWTTAIEQRSSAGRGSSNKFSLYGIKKLRELILELAVRGKLVPQDPNDEPASVLLERIAQEKAQLVKDKKIKKLNKLPEISEEDKLFLLPDKWEWCYLSDIITFINGYAFKSSTFQDNGVGIVKIGDISPSGYLTPETMSRVPDSIVKDLDENLKVFNGELVIAMSGATTGKLGFNKTDQIFYLNQRVGKIVPHQINLNYLYFPLTTKIAENLAKSLGSAIPNLSTSQINEIVLALPPKQEQQRIVTKVDELMLLCDQLEQQTESGIAAHKTLVEVLLTTLTDSKNAQELQQNWARVSEFFDTLFTTEHSIDQLKQTILQLAVMGKLVPQDPNDEPASKLLERIAAEKALLIKDKKIKKQKPLPPITEVEKPFVLPNGWEWVRLNEVADYNGRPNVAPSKIESESWLLDLEDIEKDTSKLTYRATYSERYSKSNKSTFQKGDVLYGKLRPYLNKVIVADATGVCTTEIVAIVPSKAIYAEYLKCLLKSSTFLNYVNSLMYGVKMPRLGTEDAVQSVHPLPPLEEQHRIVTKVDQLMAICDQLKVRLTDAQSTQVKIAETVVEQAVE